MPVQVGARLGEATDGRIRLVLYAATLLDGAPTARCRPRRRPLAGRGELDEVGWLPIDRDLLPLVAVLLERRGEG